jgi:hypothetical protein
VTGAALLLDGNIEAASRAFANAMTYSSGNALLYALRAYYNFKAANPRLVTGRYLFFVDFGLSSTERRGIVFDMTRRSVDEGPFHVAHGERSGQPNSVPTVFSNTQDTHQTSLGLYVTGSSYRFPKYDTVGVLLDGHSDGFNDNARRREIVIHGADYVNERNAGRSWGCPAVELGREELLRRLANGSVVFHFSPDDSHWMDNDPWVHYRGFPATDST